jgi:hypothetical protein
MHNFLVIVLNDMLRKVEGLEDYTTTNTLRDKLGAFTIGTMANHPTLSKWDGANLYYVPLAQPDNVSYVWTWEELQAAYKAISDSSAQVCCQGSIATSFTLTHLNDGEGRLYISLAALAGLTHLPGWSTAYDWLNSQLYPLAKKEKPQWGAQKPYYATAETTCEDNAAFCSNESACTTAWPAYHWCTNVCQSAACDVAPSAVLRPLKVKKTSGSWLGIQ